MKKIFAMLLAVLTALSLCACATQQQPAQAEPAAPAAGENPAQAAAVQAAPIVIKAAVVATDEATHSLALKKMEELIEAYTNGAVDFQVYTNGQLGSEREIVEGVGLGTIEVGVVSTGPLPNFVPDFMVLDLPYLVTDKAKAFEILDGEVGEKMLGQLSAIGVKGISFWDNGFRYITSSTPIAHPEDVKGMKIRTMENEVHMATFAALGATPTPMAISEFLTAVRQGTVDGHENVMVGIWMNKVYEVNPYITLSKHFFSSAPFLVNEAFYNGLPEDIRAAFDKAEAETRVWEREYCVSLDDKLIEDMKALGTIFIEIDEAEWKEATKSVYDQYSGSKIDPALIEMFKDA